MTDQVTQTGPAIPFDFSSNVPPRAIVDAGATRSGTFTGRIPFSVARPFLSDKPLMRPNGPRTAERTEEHAPVAFDTNQPVTQAEALSEFRSLPKIEAEHGADIDPEEGDLL